MAGTISAIAALLWPALLLIALLMFRRPLHRVIQSAEQRKWTLKVGGQELGMEELSTQQNTMIADLQKQVGALSRVVADLTRNAQLTGRDVDRPVPPAGWNPPAPAPQEVPQAAVPGAAVPGAAVPGAGTKVVTAHAVLWVDDHPENNALLIEQLQRNDVRVDLAKSTTEALAYLRQRRYGAILSDMGRTENGADVPDAGLRLLKAVRDSGILIPVLFYTSAFAERTYGQQAADAGAEITSSPTILFERLQTMQLL